MLRYLTAGESHGKSLVAILDGVPANLSLSANDINPDLERRQLGVGRGPRMKIEKDKVEILSGVRRGKTMGGPIALQVPNRSTELFDKVVTLPRPGHADLAGAIKYHQLDIRNVLERASARETAARVAAGAVAKKLLAAFKIKIESRIIEIGGEKTNQTILRAIESAEKSGDTLGGIFEITASNVPVGLGSYTQADKRLNARLCAVLMSIPAIKGVEVGLGFEYAASRGSEAHDEIFYSKDKRWHRRTNHAGGIEGGISNSEPIVIRAAMKPIPTLRKPLASAEILTHRKKKALVERSDVCAVPAAAVIGEAVTALELANAFLEKFGGDSIEEIKNNLAAYLRICSVI